MTLVVEGVTRSVGGETHLADIDLVLEPGLHVVIGRTLAGKTSLLRLLAGLDRPSGGRILIDGQETRSVPVNRRRVAFVYQQFINYPGFTVYDNIAAPLRRSGVARREIDGKVRETAEVLRIEGLLDRLPAELSGGQQQRVAIARALVKEADLFLLDEPLANLDYKLREELREELRTVFRRSARTVVYTTTEPTEALMMGGNAIVLFEGRVLQTGPVLETYRAPASTAVAEVFSDPPMNLVAGRLAGESLSFAGLTIPWPAQMRALPAGAVTVGIRPNHLTIDPAADGAALAGKVELSEVNGSETFVHVFAGEASFVVEREGVHPTPSGQAVRLGVEPANLYAFSHGGDLLALPERGPAP
ncbi:MAG: ABC transporter ATP-binding protein [Rhodospirillales bacterium]